MNLSPFTIVAIVIVILSSCQSFITEADDPNFQNEGHKLVYEMVQNVGNYEKLRSKKDVVYTYTYQTPNGETDISTEKYIFDGERSYGKYLKHERTLASLEGVMEQGYDGEKFWLKIDGEVQKGKKALKQVAFNRPTNFYWFTMFQKLLDPGLRYELLEEKIIGQRAYDVVQVGFESKDGKPKDVYQLYINRETKLVDQFLFTVADFGKMDIPNLMLLEYETIDGIMIPTNRKYKQSTWDAAVNDNPWVTVKWSDINFDNGLTYELFSK